MLRRHPLAAFFALSFAISWGLAGFYWVLRGLGLGFLSGGKVGLFSWILFLLAVWAPTVSALTVSWALGGWLGLRDLLSRLSPRRAGLVWWGAALLVPLGTGTAATLLAGSVAGIGSAWLVPEGGVAGLLTSLGMMAIGGPLGQELGWRGFALPRLARRMTALSAALLVGVAWAAWHLPVLAVPRIKQAFLPPDFPVLAFPFYLVAASVLVAWIYLRGGQCLWLAALFHLVLLWGVHAFSRDPTQALVWGGAAAYLAAAAAVAATPTMRRRG